MLERREAVLVDRVDPLPGRFRKFLDKPPDQQGDILDTFPQWRHLNGKHIQPVVQVLAKRTFGNSLLKIAMRGGDDPGVDGNRPRTSQPFDLTLFQDPQKLDLHLGRQVPDLVEKDRRAVGQLESAHLT